MHGKLGGCELRACWSAADWLEACKPCSVQDPQVLCCSENQVPLIYNPRIDRCLGNHLVVLNSVSTVNSNLFYSWVTWFWSVVSSSLQGRLPVPRPPQSHPTPKCTRCPAAQPALPLCCPTPCHSSPLCLYLTSFHFASPPPSPFPANPLLSHSRLSGVLTSFFSGMGSGKPTYDNAQSSGKNPATSSPSPSLPSSFCLSWLLFCLLLTCKHFEGSARIWSIEFH